MNRRLKLFLLCGVMAFILLGCEKVEEITDEQIVCEHQWTSIEWDIFAGVHRIYCPKCKLEKTVSNTEWNKIEADMQYMNR